MTTRASFDVEFAAHQFALIDADVKTNHARRWSGDYVDIDWDTVGTADGVVTVFSPRAGGFVPVEVVVLDHVPDLELTRWSQVVEASLEVRGSALRIETESSDFELPLGPGSWRVRACAAALETCEYDGDTGDDRYRVELWPAPPAPSTVLKRFEPA